MEETERLVQGEINKIFPALCILLFRCFKDSNICQREQIREFAKHIQKNWRKESDVSQKKNSTCNKQLPLHRIQLLEKQKNVTDVQVNLSKNPHKLVYEDIWSETFVKQTKEKSKTLIKPIKQITQEMLSESTHPNLDDNRQSIGNILTLNDELERPNHPKFDDDLRSIGNILTVNDEIKKRSPYLPTILHEVLFDKAEHLSQIPSNIAGPSNKNQLSEDSGVYSEDVLDDGSVKKLPFLDVNITTHKKSVAVTSIESILKDIKTEIDLNIRKVFYNWKDSVVQHSCSLVSRCALKGAEYEEVVKHFTIDLLQEIWSSMQINQHRKWSHKIDILKELISTPAICLEILYFIAEVLENVTTGTKKGFCTSLLLVKLAIFLDLIPFMVRRFNVLLNTSRSQSSQKVVNVAKLWQEKLSSVLIEEDPEDMEQVIKTDIIPKLTNFLTCTAKKQPLMYLKAKEALDYLEDISRESQPSQDSLSNMY